MIRRKSAREIAMMREAGRIAARAREIAGEMVVPGAATRGIDKRVHDYIVSQGAVPTFLGYNGFPASTCISVNDEIIHGIPSGRKLKDGDVVSIDVGATLGGYIGDCAATFIAGDGSEEAKRLVEVTKQCFFEAMTVAREGNRVSDISRTVQRYAEESGYSVVRDFVGHGVGTKMHEPPEVPNFIKTPRSGSDPRLMPGMTLAIEPMVNTGTWRIRILSDKWTVVTADGGLSAHYENTILITSGEPEILTVC